MISAMPAVAVRRGRKRSKTFGRFALPSSQRSSTSSLSGQTSRLGQSVSTINGAAFRYRRRYDSDLEKQRRRFLIYMGTLFLAAGLMLVFIGVGAAVPTAQTVGLLLIGVGAVLCIIKVFCSEVHATEVPRKIIVRDADVESQPDAEVATPLAKIAEFSELNEAGTEAASPPNDAQTNNLSPMSPPSSVQETQGLIGNESSGRY